MFKPKFGECSCCGKPGLVVVKSGLIKQCNEQKKKDGKKDKPKKEKVKRPLKKSPLKKKLDFKKCIACGNESLIVVNAGFCKNCNEKQKKEKKKENESKRIVKLVNNAEKKKSIKSLIKELDTIFSLFIRLRDSDKDGFGKCITCPAVKHYRKMDCGHFITRGEHSIRWHEFNCALQCKKCNGFKGGEQFIFGQEINKRWGENTSENLQIKRHFSKKLDRFELQFLIKEYTEKVEKLKQEKTLYEA